jgi:hypothetical protein
MDQQTILALALRHALTTAAGALATHGYLSSSATEQFVSAGMLIAGIAWSWWQKRGQAEVVDKLNLIINYRRGAGFKEAEPQKQPPAPSVQKS